MNKRIRLGMIGGGYGAFIGIAHRIASYISEDYKFVGGVFDVDHAKGVEFGVNKLELSEDRLYATVEDFIAGENALPVEERIQAVSIVTPNFLHYAMAGKLVDAGFSVICEKPITMNAAEAEDLEKRVQAAGVSFCLTHTYTGYPMVRQMKQMIKDGAIGTIQKVDAQYYQGWINPHIHDKESRKAIWRLDPSKSGISCCIGDIGVHAFNMIEYTTGLEVTSVLAQLSTLYDDNPLDVDGTVLLKFKENITGIVRASQIATGDENTLTIQVYGQKGGLRWEQENPNYLYLKKEGEPLQVFKPGHEYNSKFSLDSTRMAPGHPEGIFDSMGNIYKGAAKAIRGEQLTDGDHPTVRDGVRGMHFIEKSVKSNAEGNVWTKM